MDDKLELVIRSIRKTRNRLGCGFFFIFSFGVLMLYLSFATDEGGAWSIAFGVFLLLLSALGVKVVWPSLKPAQAPLVKLLKEKPENIAWIYDVADPAPRGRTITHSIQVCDTDKRTHTFMVKVAEVEGMLETLKTFAPKATYGFSKENHEKFQQDPWSMISKE